MTLSNNILDSKKEYLRSIEKLASPLQKRVSQLIKEADTLETPRDVLQWLHETQRISMIYTAGAQNNSALIRRLSEYPLWEDLPRLPLDETPQRGLANAMFGALYRLPDTSESPQIMLKASPESGIVTEHMAKTCFDRGINFDVDFDDPRFATALLNAVDGSAVEKLATLLHDKYDPVTKWLLTSLYPPAVEAGVDPEKSAIYADGLKEAMEKKKNKDGFYTLTLLPTAADAKLDDIPHLQYLDMFFNLCHQPWPEIKEAQAKLIEEFNAANFIRIENSDGTHITLDVKGQTFANSVVGANVPGSEIFTGPVKTGANGTVVAKGRYRFDERGIIEDIRFTIVDGKIIEASASTPGQTRLLNEILDTDKLNGDEREGSRYLGELGIGTNPYKGVDKPLINRLLTEKLGGTVHITPGGCYTYPKYNGVPVKVSNGNESKIHWDISFMLRGKEGKIYLMKEKDDRAPKLIQDDGRWIGEQYAVLNEGWKALDRTEPAQPGGGTAALNRAATHGKPR